MATQDFFREPRPKDSKIASQDLEMFRGDTFQFKAVIVKNGQPQDITGGYFWVTLKEDINDLDDNAVIQKTTDSGISVISAENGQIEVTISPEDTEALDLDDDTTYYWDLQYEDYIGNVQTIFKGKFTVMLDVTRTPAFVNGLWLQSTESVFEALPLIYGVNPAVDGTVFIDEEQRVHFSGVTGGTFTLTVLNPLVSLDYQTTDPITFVDLPSLADDIEAALEDIAFIDDVSTYLYTDNNDPSATIIRVVFSGAGIDQTNFELMTIDGSNLVGETF
jgi:hypothetical protein